MIALALFFFAAFGFAFIVGHSKISLPFRIWVGGITRAVDETASDEWTERVREQLVKLGKDPHWVSRPLVPVLGPFLVALVECVGCLGWWTGAVVGALCPAFVQLAAPGIDELALSWWSCGLILGLATSGVNMLLGKFVGMVE